MILNQFTPIPNGTGFFQNIDEISFDAAKGQIAFIAEGLFGQQGIYLYGNGKQILKAVDKQTVMPDKAAKFYSFQGVSSDNNIIVFTAADYDKKHVGLYLYMNKKIFVLLSNKDVIDNKKVSDFYINHTSLEKNKLALVIKFKDGSSALYIATLSPP